VSSAIEILLADHDNVFARHDRLLIQVRRGVLTVDVIERIAIEGNLTRARHSGRPIALVSVVEASAVMTSAEVRARSRAVIRGFAEHRGTAIALVIEGEGAAPSIVRTMTRALLIGQPQLRTAPTVEGIALWVADHLGIHSADVIESVARVRATATL
jgi:hypothetical protein